MKYLWRVAIAAALLYGFAAISQPVSGQGKGAQEVTALLREFMDAAGRGDREVFDKFFAEDVIYTRGTGVVISKTDIMESLKKPPAESEGKTTYTAEDITVHEYTDVVIVAFRLEGRTEQRDGKIEAARYRNTGTFLKRHGRWQAVAWQATRISDAAKAQ